MKRTGNRLLIILLLFVSLLAGCSKQETTKMASVEDMANKRIGVCSGFIYDKFATERFPAATVLRYNSQSDLLLALKSDKVDVAITNFAAAKNMLKTSPEVGILTDEILTFPIGVGFSKNNPELRNRFNVFLQASKADVRCWPCIKNGLTTTSKQLKCKNSHRTPSAKKSCSV